MASKNTITILGYLGRDPELRHTPAGNPVTDFSIATTDKRGDEETTTWFRVSVFGRQADACATRLAKGSQVLVEGRLSEREWNDRDGNRRHTLEVTASDVTFVSPAERAAVAAGGAGGDEEIEDEDLPF